MTGKERVERLLAGADLDRPPIGELCITSGFIEDCGMDGRAAVLAHLNQDIITLPLPDTPVPQWREWQQSPYFSLGLFSGPFTRLIRNLGWKQAARLMVKQADEAQGLMHQYLEQIKPHVIEALDAGCQGLVMADDMAGGRGLLVSPAFLKRRYFPVVADFLESDCFCAGTGRPPIFFHCDGYVLELVAQVRSAGFTGIQGLQPGSGLGPQCFDPHTYKGFLFWGNFEFEGDQALKGRDLLIPEVGATLSDWSPFSYIFGSSGGLYKNLDPQSVKGVCDQAAGYGE